MSWPSIDRGAGWLAVAVAVHGASSAVVAPDAPTQAPSITVQETAAPVATAAAGIVTPWIATGSGPRRFVVAVPFRFDRSGLRDGTQWRALREGLKWLKWLPPGTWVRVDGHADVRGSTAYNIWLGRRRAQHVAAWIERALPGRLQLAVRTYGEGCPRAANGQAVGRRLNRRVEIRLVPRRCPIAAVP